MKLSADSLVIIKNFEGFRNKTYTCPAGFKTIGYGHLIANDNAIEEIDEVTACELLAQDLFNSEKAVSRNISVPLTQGQFDALVSFTFNVGAGALQRSTLRQKINRLEYEDASGEFLRWIYANGVKIAGLVSRRNIEMKIFAS